MSAIVPTRDLRVNADHLRAHAAALAFASSAEATRTQWEVSA
jgi:hypothetical protein